MNTRALFGLVWLVLIVFVCLVLVRPDLMPGRQAGADDPSRSSTTVTPAGGSNSSPLPRGASGEASGGAGAAGRTAEPVVDVSNLLRPSRKYLGIAMDGAAADPRLVDRVSRELGIRPNMITTYQAFGDPFPAADALRVHRGGALLVIRWEPFTARLRDIAEGRFDHYVSTYAEAIRALDVPVAITFAHEMNGFWYPWDAHHVSPSDYLDAWRRIHDLFRAAGATNVIWSWAPNEISGGPGVRLVDWYPGDAYVDWVGVDGYFTANGPADYDALFGPTLAEIGRFTNRPYVIMETGAEAGWAGRHRALDTLLRGVARDERMIGFVYFNQPGSRQWQLDGDRAALDLVRTRARELHYGFLVR